MHILYFSNWYIKQTVQTANALAESHKVTLVFPEESAELNAYDGKVAGLRAMLHSNIDLITLPHMQNLDPQAWIPVMQTRRLIRELKPDIVHFNESYDFRCLLLMHLCKEVPYITSVHDPVPHSDEKISLQKFKYWVRDQIRQKSAGLIVYGESLCEKLADYSSIPIERIYPVPHGEYKYFEHFDKIQSQAKDIHQYILFFGRWEHYKGIDILIDAEPLITARFPHVKIILAGEGRLALSELQQRIVNPANFIIKNYSIPDEEVPALYKLSDIVVLPYREATQSGPLHIAGSFARPTVVTAVGALPEVVKDGETGILIEPNNPQALADAVCRLLEDPDYAKQMGQNAQSHITAAESMERVAEVQTDVYRKVIEASQQHRSRLMSMLQSLVKKIKRDPHYTLDDSMLPGDMVAMLGKLGMALLRGLWHRSFLKQTQGLYFIGKRVKLRNRKHIYLGRNFIAEDDCEIQGASKSGIRFGDNVTVGSFSMIRPSGYYGRELGVGLKVGDRSNIGPFAYIGCSGGITIGDDVMMGPRVSLFAENHNFKGADVTMRSQGVTRQPIVVEDDCWLASGSIILAGVTVGKGSIVAAGSVVTKNVPPYSIAAGSPAQVIKSRHAFKRPDEAEMAEAEAEISRLTKSEVAKL
ncbi:glycosyltransferase [bacterium]|nr:glycosyltransferase [bacterium]